MTSHENTKIYKAHAPIRDEGKTAMKDKNTVTISVKIPTYNRLMQAKVELTEETRKTQTWDNVITETLERVTRLENLVSELETINRQLEANNTRIKEHNKHLEQLVDEALLVSDLEKLSDIKNGNAKTISP